MPLGLIMNYMDFFQDYFTTSYVVIALVIGISILCLRNLAFALSKTASTKSRLLISITVTSASLWVFVLSSLAFCMMLIQH